MSLGRSASSANPTTSPNQRRIGEGRSADALAPVALAEADHAFELLRNGLTPYAGAARSVT